MASNTSISLINLDFDTFKSSLRSYLQQQAQFKDYDFIGSNMSVFLDILAYNTYHNAFYLNMVGNEMFLDTSLQRDSVISHAKELNYIPQSFRSAKALVDLVITPDFNTKSVVTIPKNTQFSTTLGSNSYTFSTNKTLVVSNSVSGVFTANNVELYEGTYLAESFVMNYTDENQRFIISTPLVDVSSISVVVAEDSKVTQFSRAQSLLDISEISEIWFLQGAEKDRYEIVFGNNIFGRRPKNGATILVEYRVSAGELPNGASSFGLDSPIDGCSNVIIGVVTKATGGSIYESTSSIKYAAPRHYTTQERAVTANDYKILLEQQFPEIHDINVYGGEELTPPQYGRVIVAVDIFGYDGIPTFKKNEYKSWIKNKTPLTIEPYFVDPLFIYAKVEVTSKFNSNVTDLTSTDISTRIHSTINKFNADNYDKFTSKVRSSKLLSTIDETHPSIVSTFLHINPYIFLTPALYQSNIIKTSFPFPINVHVPQLDPNHKLNIEKIVTSSQFYSEDKLCQIEDDNNGNLRLVTTIGDEVRTIKNIGTIDYKTGDISINNIVPQSFIVPGGIKLYIHSEDRDFDFGKNYIFKIKDEDIDVTVQEIRE